MENKDYQILAHIKDWCQRIADAINNHGNSKDIFLENPLYQDRIAMEILQIGQISNYLSKELKKSSANIIPWQKIHHVRNIFAHHKNNLNIDELWDNATIHIPVLYEYCKKELSNHEAAEEKRTS
ncbi:MAG: DUF86 domain-containing protein [Deltaproteobacteria bacterium]|jgi:uncharacterized protein with HEPN domain|nr:DUF86 domain-containing protein [Deltaproteobacteria bacterium]